MTFPGQPARQIWRPVIFLWGHLKSVVYTDRPRTHRKIRENDGFGVSKVVTSTEDKKENKEHGNRQKI